MPPSTEQEKSEKFYGCYLLVSRSEMPRFKGRTYIGFTVDAVRRLRQHNSGVKSGGARRTNNRGPWDMVLVVHGFPNEISALRFEWAWQHPQESRRLQAVCMKKGYREKQVQYRIRVLTSMLKSGPWNRLSLTICWLREDFHQQFPNLEHPSHMIVKVGLLPPTKKLLQTEEMSEKNEDELGRSNNCFFCNTAIILKRDELACPVKVCKTSFHIECLANRLTQGDKHNLIPIDGQCPNCEKQFRWGDLVRNCL